MMPAIPETHEVRLVNQPRGVLGTLNRPQKLPWKPAPMKLAQASTDPGIAKRAVAALGTVGAGLIAASFGAAVTYVGIRTGLRDKGFPQVLGYIVGITAGLSTLLTLGTVVTGGVKLIAGKNPEN